MASIIQEHSIYEIIMFIHLIISMLILQAWCVLEAPYLKIYDVTFLLKYVQSHFL